MRNLQPLKKLFQLLTLDRVLMPDIRRLREEIKPSKTDEGDGMFSINEIYSIFN